MRSGQGVFIVLLLLSLVFNSICLGMMAMLTDCAYQQYLTYEISSACDKQYSYNNVRVWSCVYLPHDMISFTLVEGTVLVLLTLGKRAEKPLFLTGTAALCLLATTGAQIHGLSRHALGDEDYTNFSEAFASFCILDCICMTAVTVLTFRKRNEVLPLSPSPLHRPHQFDFPDSDSPRAQLVDAPPAYQAQPVSTEQQQLEEEPETV